MTNFYRQGEALRRPAPLRQTKIRLPTRYRLGTGTQAVVVEAHRNDRKIRKASQPSLQKIRPDCFVAEAPRNDRLKHYLHAPYPAKNAPESLIKMKRVPVESQTNSYPSFLDG